MINELFPTKLLLKIFRYILNKEEVNKFSNQELKEIYQKECIGCEENAELNPRRRHHKKIRKKFVGPGGPKSICVIF
jgi:hypothetical protein